MFRSAAAGVVELQVLLLEEQPELRVDGGVEQVC